MKYANFIYEYNHFGRYKPTTCNLGDYIQSLAARQYFPNVDFFVDRDGLSGFRNEFKCKLIANGWYYLFDGCHQWSDCLEPLLTSVHINNTDNANEFHNVLDKLKAASQKKSYRMQGLCDTKIFTIKWYCMFLFFMFNNNSAKKRLF